MGRAPTLNVTDFPCPKKFKIVSFVQMIFVCSCSDHFVFTPLLKEDSIILNNISWLNTTSNTDRGDGQ